MNLQSAQNLAYSLMNRHALLSKGWSFEFDNSVRRFGLCSYGRHTISLSRNLVVLNDESKVLDVILHEIAHALVGGGHGHDAVWQAKCREIGARPERCYSLDEVETPKLRYVAVCGACKKEWQKHREPNKNRIASCSCQAGIPWDKRVLLKYVKRY